MLVRNRTAAEQTELRVKVRTMFLLTAGSNNVFFVVFTSRSQWRRS